jgi:ribosomal protein L29
MANKVFTELKGLKITEIETKIEGWRRELFGLRLNVKTSHVKNYAQFSTLRKNIARGLTCLVAVQGKISQQKSEG